MLVKKVNVIGPGVDVQGLLLADLRCCVVAAGGQCEDRRDPEAPATR